MSGTARFILLDPAAMDVGTEKTHALSSDLQKIKIPKYCPLSH